MRFSILLLITCSVGVIAAPGNPSTTTKRRVCHTVKPSTTTTSATSTILTTSTTPTTSTRASTTSEAPCPYVTCIKSTDIPEKFRPEASSFCSYVLRSSLTPVTSITTVTITTTTGIAPAVVTATDTTTITSTITSGTTCPGSTTTVPASTLVAYRVRGSDPADVKRRALETRDIEEQQLDMPNFVIQQCKGSLPILSKLKSACSCLVTASTTLTTSTVTTTFTITAVAATTTITTTSTTSTTVRPCTSTVNISSTQLTACGVTFASKPTASSSGTVTCAAAAAPGETNNPFRIEGGAEGNIFDGCITTGARNITTPSGGTHLCDGTNNNANPAPGGTLTTDIDSAGRKEGFSFDGTYSNQFQDFFISSISATTQSGNQFWGVLRNRVFTSRGGCQEQVSVSDEGLWAYDAFAPNRVFLSVTPSYAVATVGSGNVVVTVLATNPNSGTTVPAQGAAMGASSVAGSDGKLSLPVPSQPGCYMYKAEITNGIRSNAFYLSVFDSFSS